MENILPPVTKPRVFVPVTALAMYAVASGYFMSLIPLMLPLYGLDTALASWLASLFYAGLLLGAVSIEPLVTKMGHKNAFVSCLGLLVVTIAIMPMVTSSAVWLTSRFVAGIAVAGVFVIVESWLLHGEESDRAKRLGLYMGSLYGGTSLGQLGIGLIGVSGNMPFIVIFTMLLLAIGVLLLIKSDAPHPGHSQPMSLGQISKLNHAAIIGCIVSGLTLGAIYGLMPLALSLRGIATDDVGSLMALIILGAMAVQPLIPLLSKYMDRTLLMALFCLLGVAAIALTTSFGGLYALGTGLFLLGMAVFALYPVAINLGCDKLGSNHIVAATQVMLFSYSIGSVAGPIVAGSFMSGRHGLPGYLFCCLLATSVYMLIVSIKTKRQAMAGE
ncbi:MFS transporter [Salinimonas lutimaris]|uniref:MFS transporter n=1 Tax=Salinimonas lutimaris TaxID=914153 RepID=UPI0010C00726|nr:MFS transporter [Salinimonas lutimaris]